MTSALEISRLETELKELQKKRGDVENRLKTLENKEKVQQGLLGKRNRAEFPSVQNKRLNTGGEGKKREEGRGPRDESRSSFNSRGINDREREREPNNKPGRLLSSVVTSPQKSGLRDSRESRDSRNVREPHSNRNNREEPRKPKLTSAIVSSTPIPVVGEKPRPSLDTSGEETKKRSRNMFTMLVGTLQSFKNDISNKSEADQRREELEQKIQTKVKEEAENFKEEQRRILLEQKEKEQVLRDEIKQQQEQKELQLLNLKWDNHRSELSAFLKTEAKPAIYYRPAKLDHEIKKNDQKSNLNSEEKSRTEMETNEKREDEEKK